MDYAVAFAHNLHAPLPPLVPARHRCPCKRLVPIGGLNVLWLSASDSPESVGLIYQIARGLFLCFTWTARTSLISISFDVASSVITTAHSVVIKQSLGIVGASTLASNSR
ncbi:hypothetical protein CVT26_006317 [Gymnopilus dilepis]|uniref:Uncharacterized protein n=1 Tax=Gymnopilus dilepis TaxID=231916 RepID=A0A409W636_9AGAR|nr:hypothetical protein CVT26_006317 [Gymnopilus dilepis]